MRARTSPLLLALALTLAACNDQPEPTGPTAMRPVFATFAVGCDVADLIAAINAANADPDPDVIDLEPGCTYTLTSAIPSAVGPNGLPLITSPIAINGNGARIERSSEPGTDEFRIFGVHTEGSLSISQLTVANGGPPAGFDGGALFNFGAVTIEHTTFSGNTAARGGAISNGGPMVIARATFSHNESSGSGGAIANFTPMTITGSDFSGNVAGADGGAVISVGSLEIGNTTFYDNTSGALGGAISNRFGSTTMLNSTVSANRAGARGGGIANYPGHSLTVSHSSIVGNTADVGPGGGIRSGGSLTLRSSLIAGNTDPTSPDVSGGATVTYSLIGSSSGHTIPNGADGNIVGVPTADVGLGALAHNGGPTRTHALLVGSPAIDAGACTDAAGAPVTTDQRGIGRPQPAGGSCDIGAYELGYDFAGFFAPVSNQPTVNRAKAGSAIPIKFSVGGDQGLDIFAEGYPQVEVVACESSDPQGEVSETVSAGGSSLTYDLTTDHYTYVWKTGKTWANTCRELTLMFADETTVAARFYFTR